jgi:outer membrane protein assembly factor BamD (BamD/ComL family)
VVKTYKEDKMKVFKVIATAVVAIVGFTIADRKFGWKAAEKIEEWYDKGIDKISRKDNSDAATETADA